MVCARHREFQHATQKIKAKCGQLGRARHRGPLCTGSGEAAQLGGMLKQSRGRQAPKVTLTFPAVLACLVEEAGEDGSIQNPCSACIARVSVTG
ncbi:hypothetical protein NDU88_002778 [Pleurodeles waltl]|uniref:Uncharacterized protein n=1 Tax=Pleurodeles waltl TaxID=8319 RepID=A0AAV7SEI6_PLEWA|nr:hypothetical protein NDU88_002778 [Pleurodeles waltl]